MKINIQGLFDWIYYERHCIRATGNRLFGCLYWGYWPEGYEE